MRRIMGWMLVTTMFVGGAAACGSDSKDSSKSSDTTAAQSADTKAGSGSDSGASSNADVEAFCKQADDLAAKLKDVMKDPTKGNLSELTTSAQDLAKKAAELTSANASDSGRIQECAKKVTDAVSGG
jgi:hypothetical protein